jgi:hypothetical protein
MDKPRIRSSAELRLSYWRDGFTNQAQLERSFDAAIKKGDFVEVRGIADLINETAGSHRFGALQNRMRAIAAPAFEQVHNLRRKLTSEYTLGTRLDNMHANTIAVLDRETQFREGLLEVSRTRTQEMTGIISEFVIMGLLNKDGRHSPYAGLPSSREQDFGVGGHQSVRTGIDFTVVPVENVNQTIKLQVKTTPSVGKEYSNDILVVPVTDLVEEEGMSRRRAAKTASELLPRALVNIEADTATDEEAQLVGSATVRLALLLEQHRERKARAS